MSLLTLFPDQFLLTHKQIYVGKLGNAYFKNGEVAGQTDFFYGFGTAWVEKTSIALRSCGGGITAWKGTNTTFVNKYGVYIVDSNVHAANSSLNIVGKCPLGRPWVLSLPYTLYPLPSTLCASINMLTKQNRMHKCAPSSHTPT